MSSPSQSQEHVKALIDEYLHLTGHVLPEMSKTDRVNWPVTDDHCFQRIVLDNICQGAWYDFIKAPAYRYLSDQQAADAVSLCHQIINGDVDLSMLNVKSLAWRNRRKQQQGELAL